MVESVSVNNKDVPSFCFHREYGYELIQHRNNEYCHILEHHNIDQRTDQHSDKSHVASLRKQHPDVNDRNGCICVVEDLTELNSDTYSFNNNTLDEYNDEIRKVMSNLFPDIRNKDHNSFAKDVVKTKEQFDVHTLDEKIVEQDIEVQPNIEYVGLNMPESHTDEENMFIPHSDSQMQSFSYVCIEYDEELDENKVVIYRSETNEVVQLRMYNLTFSKQDMPSSHMFISEYPAYFVVFQGTSSFYHHYEDVVVNAYYLLKYTGRLHASLKSQIYFYHNGLYEGFKEFYTHTFLMELPLRPDYFEVYTTKPNICYKNAAFSFGHDWFYGEPSNLNIPKQIARQEVTHFLKQTFHLGERCSYKTEIVLLNRRSQRRILNSLELLLAAIKNGFSSISIVYFEDLNLLEQAEVASCARIFILVQGSALIWIPFMPPNSAVIEISWPQKNWMFHANFMFARDPYLHLFKLQIPTNDLYPDLGYFLMYTPLENQSRDYFKKALQEWPENPFLGNPYKFTHCLVDVNAFLEIMKQADLRLRSHSRET